jgi:DNA-binding response OmpR family regulator
VIRDEAESAGAVKYVTKPFSPSQLLAEAKLAMGVV